MTPVSLLSYLLVLAMAMEIADLLLTHPQGLLKLLGFCHILLLSLFQAEKFCQLFHFSHGNNLILWSFLYFFGPLISAVPLLEDFWVFF